MNKFTVIIIWVVAAAISAYAVLMAGEGDSRKEPAPVSVFEAPSASEKPDDRAPGPPYSNDGTGTWFTRFKNKAVGLLDRLGIEVEAVKLYAKWIVGAPALVLAILIALLLRPRRKNRQLPGRLKPAFAKKTPAGLKKQLLAANQGKSDSVKTNLPDKTLILQFFSTLFNKQINADSEAPTQYALAETRSTCPNESYEMRVLHKGDWQGRRMSIGLLGQGGGSRSRCFYVIYDTHMVIKIPADKITDFDNYKRQIADEGLIVARLAPRECIVPRVSVILKAVHTIPGSENFSDEKLEKKYLQLLKFNPGYMEYLKIGGSFAFFMDLARHFFLSTTLEDLHKGGARLVDEVMQHPDLLWDQNGFICRYGEQSAPVCHKLQEVYYRCERQLRNLVDEAAIVDDVPLFRFKQWFLLHLAGERIAPGDQDLPQDLIDKANRLLSNTLKKHQKQVRQYRRDVREYMHEIQFSKHRTQLESLVTNTLDLLNWIGSRGLALRDLKPENLFVAGNPDDYPVFLNDPAKFTIGLIDVETAVVFDGQDPEKIPQPQLAGTPLYCTPAHLMTNTVLSQVYPDIRKILHLQDWWATLAILFKIVTGENLFMTTARVFPEIISRLKVMDPSGIDLEKDIIRISSLFWNSATAEFREAMQKHGKVLTRIEAAVPAAMLADIVRALHQECDQITGHVAAAVNGQSFFTSETKRRFLLEAPAAKIRQMKTKLVQDPQGRHQREQALEFFERLEGMKGHLQRKLEAAALLKATGAPIAADQLLEAIFQKVFSAMYLPQWPSLAPARWQGGSRVPEDIATYQATM